MRYYEGDTVRDNDGIEKQIVAVSISYILSDGKETNGNELELVSQVDRDKQLVLSMCDKLDVTYQQLRSNSRKRYYVLRRQVISYFLRYKYKWTYVRISNKLNRKHCSIVYDVNACSEALSINDYEIKSLCDKIKY